MVNFSPMTYVIINGKQSSRKFFQKCDVGAFKYLSKS